MTELSHKSFAYMYARTCTSSSTVPLSEVSVVHSYKTKVDVPTYTVPLYACMRRVFL